MAPELDPEPWNWSPEDVVHFFQDKAAAYISDLPHGQLPPLDAFVAVLRENEVDGATLLTEIDVDFLKADCGITKLAIRGAILRCIKKLRGQSPKYAREQSTSDAQPSILASTPALAPVPNPQLSPVSPHENLAERTRSAEVQFQDPQGKKRRKLDLSKLVPVQEVQTKTEEPQPAAVTTAFDSGYLSSSPRLIDQIFYGNTEFGGEVGDLNPEGEVLISPVDRKAELQDQNFQFTSHGKPLGEARYVYKQLHHFLANGEANQIHDIQINGETEVLKRHNRMAVAIVPYRDGLSQFARSATVLQFRPGMEEPIAIRESLEHLESSRASSEYKQEHAGEWDFLVEKHKSIEDEVLPIYGDSDDEGGDDSLETTEGDLGQDAAEEVDDRVVSTDHAAEIIEESIKGYIVEWRNGLEALEKKKAWSIWKETKGSRKIRDYLIDSARAKIEHFSTRLNKIKKELMDCEYRTEKAVREACVSLEVTVQVREEQQWMIGIWQRRQEPFHVARHGQKRGYPVQSTSHTAGKAGPALQILPDDRLSVSPAPAVEPDAGIETEEDIRYDADEEEEYHTPAHSPESSDEVYAALMNSSDKMASSPDDDLPDADDEDELEPNTDTETMPNDPLPGDDDNDSSFSPKGESPDSDELASPSTFTKSIKPTSGRKSVQPPSSAHIDLTTLSSDSSPPTKRKRANVPTTSFRGQPLDATAADVDAWDMQHLRQQNDRMRILIKHLRDAGAQKRDQIQTYFSAKPRPRFNAELRTACQTIKSATAAGADPHEFLDEVVHLTATICLSWTFITSEPQQIIDMDSNKFNAAINDAQIMNFTGQLQRCLIKKNSSLFNDAKHSSSKSTPSKRDSAKPRSSTPIEISSDSQGLAQERTPHIKRKRLVQRSASAVNSRNKALQREQKFVESQTANSSQLAAMLSSDPSSSAIEINPVREDGEDPVYICDRIARKMKSHQVDGVQFLWREITADDDDGAQGCLLAHTMGLGKTMQTIALLVAVNEAARSKKRGVYRQVPSHLRDDGIRSRMLRVLILCPPALIENWHREITQWAPKLLGHIFSLDSGTKTARMDKLEDWMRLGGVVLLGYQKFRSMVLQKSNPNEKVPMPEQQQDRLRQLLVEGPEIVVADEAHNLKNNKSDLGKAVGEIETHSRIGLTGTPMSNDVDEIFALISWAAPGYLGDSTEFRAHYTEPIKAGLWPDSSSYERRKSIMKLKVLHSEIQPKVNRANIEVLRGSLKSKVEFVITVPLGEVQTELYKRYINALTGDDVANVRIFGWLAVLTLLTNHPRCFRLKLLAPPIKKAASKRIGQNEDADDDDTSRNRTPSAVESGTATPASEYVITTTEQLIEAEASKEAPADESLHKLGFTESMIQELLDGFEDNIDPQLSAKVTIFTTLLDYSIKCGDKVLVFSSSIPTLEYLDELLTQQGVDFGRIDGKTTMKKRMDALEEFHNNEFDVMLVSTRAGGVGLNIQGANRVFIFDFGFNPTWEEQAIGRAYRLGQTKPVYVYRFVAGGTFETEIYNKQLFKTSLAQRVVDKKRPQRHAKRDTREYLYEPRMVKQENLGEWAGKDPNVLDRLLAQHGPGEEGKIDTMIRAIRTMETLQEEALDEDLNEDEQREVNMEIQQRRVQPKARRAPGATQMPPPSTAMVRLTLPPRSTQPLARPVPNVPAFAPPPSTFAGPSNAAQSPPHPMGGLPMPRMQQPYQR